MKEINTFVIISSDLDIISLMLFDCKIKILNSKENFKMANLPFFQNAFSHLLEFLLYLFLLSCKISSRRSDFKTLSGGSENNHLVSGDPLVTMPTDQSIYVYPSFPNLRVPHSMSKSQMKMCSCHIIIIHGLAHCDWLMVMSWFSNVQ